MTGLLPADPSDSYLNIPIALTIPVLSANACLQHLLVERPRVSPVTRTAIRADGNRLLTSVMRRHNQSSIAAAASSASSTAFSSAALNLDGFVSIVTLKILPVNLLSPCL